MNDVRQRRGIPTSRNVDHIAFTVPDLDKAISFFTSVLGAELLYQFGPVQDPQGNFMARQLNVDAKARCRIAMLRLGPVTNVELFEYEAPDQRREMPRNSDWGGHHMAIYVDDLDAAIAYLREQPGVTILGEPQLIKGGPIAGNRWVYFLTPWSLQMEVMHQPSDAPYERDTPSRRFGPATGWNDRATSE